MVESPTYLPFGGINDKEFYGLTTDNRIITFSPSRPNHLTYLPIMVASATNTLRAVSVKSEGKVFKCVLFFMSVEGTDMHDKLAATMWSSFFPVWVGPQLLTY